MARKVSTFVTVRGSQAAALGMEPRQWLSLLPHIEVTAKAGSLLALYVEGRAGSWAVQLRGRTQATCYRRRPMCPPQSSQCSQESTWAPFLLLWADLETRLLGGT